MQASPLPLVHRSGSGLAPAHRDIEDPFRSSLEILKHAGDPQSFENLKDTKDIKDRLLGALEEIASIEKKVARGLACTR